MKVFLRKTDVWRLRGWLLTKDWIENYKGSKSLFYRRYVDDTFCVFEREQGAVSFYNYINSQHPNVRFTMEREVHNKLAFLDVLVNNNPLNLQTSRNFELYYVLTYTSLLVLIPPNLETNSQLKMIVEGSKHVLF